MRDMKLDLVIQEAIEKLIEYNYEREASDYLDMIECDDPHEEGHIFYFMNRLNNWLNNTSTPAEEWAKEIVG